jgi:hypothetical protein
MVTKVGKRWWRQFSLAALFAVMTFVAVVLAWRGRQIEAQREAVQAIHRLRGGVFYHEQQSSLVDRWQRIWLGDSRPEYVTFRLSPRLFEQPAEFDAVQPHLRRLPSLRRLNLEGTSISDAQLPLLVQLTQLDQLNLRGTLVTKEGFNYLRLRMPDCEVAY